MSRDGFQPLDRLLGWALLAVGSGLVIIGAAQVSGARYLADQLSFLASSGIGGLTCLVLGGTLLLRSGLRDAWGKLDAIEDALPSTSAREIVVDADPLTVAPVAAADVTVDLGSTGVTR